MLTPSASALVQLDKIDEPDEPSRLSLDEPSLHELAASLARLGLLEPIGLQPLPPSDRFRLVYGHRRFRAARHLGWYTIPAVILPAHLDETEARQAENGQRVQLTPVEEARELRRWHTRGDSIADIASRVGKSETWVHHRLRLLRYPDDILEAIHTHQLPLAVADLLAQIEHAGYRAHMTDDAIRHGASAATAACWLAHYQTDRARLEHNMNTVEEIAARRATWKMYSPCEYCGTEAELQTTRIWRLCPDCTAGLLQARRDLAGQETPHAHP